MMLKEKKYSKNLSNYFVKEIKLILLIFEKKKEKSLFSAIWYNGLLQQYWKPYCTSVMLTIKM